MRLDFKALWIDDQPKHVRSFREGIQRRLSGLGFELEVMEVSSLDKVDEAIGPHVHNDGVDLVLVDYDLGSGSGGEEALAKVRKQFPYKDLIFYSADDREKLRKIAYDGGLDGLYFSTRLSLVDDTVSVIQKMLHKVMDIDHMRGVVMSATSDIDFIVERSLLATYDRLDVKEKAEFRAEVVASIRSKLEKWAKELDKAEKKGSLEAIFKLRHLCSAADRLELLLESLSKWTSDGSTYLDKAKIYRDDVVPRRNKLAHVTLREVDGRRVLDGPEGPVSEDDMTKLRKDLIEHRQNFTSIAVLIDVKLD
ncbi:response regulator [Mesorhizobium sp.]|uniref:response regulator n=1 Tax=Mesorhizobium sp. TaxID=1871066 RepID=UPI0025D9771B|nr:response regulator [Mesorhizobium sp.]